MELLEQQLASLSPAQRQLVERWLCQGQTAADEPASASLILRRPLASTAPLSFAQQRLWFLDQLEPGQALYNMPTALLLHGALDLAALSHSLTTLVARHEPLRTHFASVDGQPVQHIAPASTLILRIVDLRSLPATERAAQEQRLTTAEARRLFDLGQGPLLHAWVLRLAAEENLLLLTLHHIVADSWSLGVLVRELSILYRARVARQPNPLPELPIQYADYALWQRQWLTGAVLEAQLAYWRAQLARVPPLALPIDRPPSTPPSGQGATLPLELSLPLSQALRALSQRQGVTLFMTLLAAFQTLLARYSGQDDIAVGTPIAGRTRAETEGLVGCFVNTLVLRTDLSGNPSFEELLARVREVTLGAYTHQDLPFELLVAELQPERDLRRSPLFQVMLALQNVPQAALNAPGLTMELLDVASGTAKFELRLTLNETEQGLRGRLEYRTNLFDAPTIARLVGHLQTLLAGVAADPSQHLWQLPLLTDLERQQLLVEWNATRSVYPHEQTITELFEAQVRQRPDALALVFEDMSLTYAELDARANQLAHHLQQCGVGAETLVGVCLKRSAELVVGLLAILKAGGAYVPLDPSYPRERLSFLLSEIAAPVVLTQQALLEHLPMDPARLLCMDRDWHMITRAPCNAPTTSVAPYNLAYVIYTSGSTGRPKGVQIPHVGIVNRLLWMQDQYQLSAEDRVMQKTPFSFDVSVWEFFWPLLVGARLVLARPEGHRDSTYLVELINAEQITTIHFVPPMLQVFLEDDTARSCRSLRRVICSGEELRYELLERFFTTLACELHNLYGPTEASVDVTHWRCAPDDARRTVPIGRPVANTQMYVLDRQLQPAPIGVAGELYIGGVQLARGYLGRQELTAERFVPNPFLKIEDRGLKIEDSRADASEMQSSILYPLSSESDRLYRTGDLARYLPDGTIEFLGRIDAQVKIRGFRIEPGEVEAALAQHPAVRESVVLARPDTAGDLQLVAYIAPTNDQRPTTNDQRQGESNLQSTIYNLQSAISESSGQRTTDNGQLTSALRAFLGSKLPAYMVPSAFVLLDTLPLTPNGKLDRKALPDPAATPAKHVYTPPQSRLEQDIAAIWQQVLGVERVGRDNNFFDLGGHSLRMAQVQSLLRETLGRSVSMLDLFTYPTIGALAQHLGGPADESQLVTATVQQVEARSASARRRRELQKIARDGEV